MSRSFSNEYERSMAARRQLGHHEWMIREQGFDEPLSSAQVDLSSGPPVYDPSGRVIFPEAIDFPWRKPDNVSDNQIQTTYEAADELHLIKASASSSQLHQGFTFTSPVHALSLSLSSLQGQEICSYNSNYGLEHMWDNHGNQGYFGYLESSRNVNSSRYLRAAQELLQEFCCVWRGDQLIKDNLKLKKSQDQRNPNLVSVGSSSSKDRDRPLLPSERAEYQRRKIKLLSLLDEVDARYSSYCEQMQAMVSSFDSIVGQGAAAPYTGLARKAMSRHFRWIKDAIVGEIRASCEALGESDLRGVTKGDTPRLKIVEKKYREQKALEGMMMEADESWRPQRGLPGRSVNILRAWLFDHFLHP
ncbi:hypothetical protein CASFOL_021285 [Castilleja foliolosa]|uniref:POX domain-containing protein n=1 Tax=Castilleja foliolosa TaxID=1961234 RepID=A0ABD3CY35_9LAMI